MLGRDGLPGGAVATGQLLGIAESGEFWIEKLPGEGGVGYPATDEQLGHHGWDSGRARQRPDAIRIVRTDAPALLHGAGTAWGAA